MSRKKRIFCLEKLIKIFDYRTFAFYNFFSSILRLNQNSVFEMLSSTLKKR